MTRLFTLLFPASPAINALLATLYISGPPNFLLALCPPNIDPNSLQVMVAFAVGGLLGDTLFHLLPEIFLGEPGEAGELRFKMIEPNRNLLLGVAIMIGFVTFVAMDKGLRIATGGQGHSHPHEHDEPSTTKDGLPAALTTAIGADKGVESDGFRQRKATGNAVVEKNMEKKEASTSTKMTAYLNLIADFTHNITDGLALSSSFYASPGLGATTTMAVFFHEIPHEVGDFALLIQSGFSKRRAMGAQFVTAVGAFLGTCIGIFVNEYGSSVGTSATATGAALSPGLFGTSLSWGDMLLPFTAGTFLYVGTVAVIPELLETGACESGSGKRAELWKTAKQFAAMAAGAAIMLAYVFFSASFLVTFSFRGADNWQYIMVLISSAAQRTLIVERIGYHMLRAKRVLCPEGGPGTLQAHL
ncbi:hypothetical protein LTR66_000466 [Elasticomyces elasticus]|nr:hypothetical protein LTR50_006585 [Elasticomyces elasticus]KAK5000729.1 hypothetical protein LTR66_000466 [Elasticomyces elasticus]